MNSDFQSLERFTCDKNRNGSADPDEPFITKGELSVLILIGPTIRSMREHQYGCRPSIRIKIHGIVSV